MEEVYGVIYLITNLVNGKKYVGQTRQSLKKRIIGHKRDSRKHKVGVDADIRKYGWENFKAEIIEECTVEQLNERKKFWIRELNSNTPTGYNSNGYDKECNILKEEARAKRAAKRKGFKKSLEHRMKISLSHRHTTPYKNLLKEMERQQLTYEEISRLLGLAPQNISRKMLGRRNFTERDKSKLVGIFNKPIEYLMVKEEFL